MGRTVLDHFGIIDRELRLYIAVGANHPSNGFVAYLKYVPTDKPTIWRSRAGIFYDRVLRFYSVKNAWLASSTMVLGFDEVTMSSIPIVPHDRVWAIVDPREKAYELLHHCNDLLECMAAELVADIAMECGVDVNCVGVTGSIMFGIHNVNYSDIDIVIYGRKCVEQVITTLMRSKLITQIDDVRMNRIVENIARVHGISKDLARAVYSIPRRGLYRGREVTLVYAHDKPIPMERGVKVQRCAHVVIAKEPGDVGTVMYPAYFKSRLLSINGVDIGDEVEVLAYESVFSIPMFFGGVFAVHALLQELENGKLRLVIGVRECDSYLKWIRSYLK